MWQDYTQGYARPGPLKPLGGINQNILVWHTAAWVLYKIRLMEALPPSRPLKIDFGAIGAVAAVQNQSLQLITEMDEMQLGHYRFAPLEDLEITVNQPQADGRFTNHNAQAIITLQTRLFDPESALSELMVFRQEWPFFTVRNPLAFAIASSPVMFWGFKYMVREIARSANPDAPEILKAGYVSIAGASGAGAN
jgi:hypothetical protein